ncbi:MAG TPA: hypothetical protein VF360_01080 [Candidatus Methanoperedens sp.]
MDEWQSGYGLYHGLLETAGFVNWNPDRKEYFTLISRSGFTERMNKEAKAKGVILLMRGII